MRDNKCCLKSHAFLCRCEKVHHLVPNSQKTLKIVQLFFIFTVVYLFYGLTEWLFTFFTKTAALLSFSKPEIKYFDFCMAQIKETAVAGCDII